MSMTMEESIRKTVREKGEQMYISVPAAAKMTGLTKGLIRSLIEQGLIPAIKIGSDARYAYKINRKEFFKFLEKAEKEETYLLRYLDEDEEHDT